MEVHQLAYFESVSRHLHFTRAAEELNVAQPSVSQQIRKLENELGWRAQESFESGIRKTVEWYLANPGWVENVTSGAYQQWVDKNYGSREAVAGGAR